MRDARQGERGEQEETGREGPITRLDPIQCELLYPRSPSTPIPGVQICSRVGGGRGVALRAGVAHAYDYIQGGKYARVGTREAERERERGIYSVQRVVS